jgi:hypothetical protein
MLVSLKARVLPSVIVSGLCLLGLGCEARKAEIPGSYRVQYPYGIERLSIAPDGGYEQRFAEAGKEETVVNRGRWEWREGTDAPLILNGPVIVDDGFGRMSKDLGKRNGIWPLRVRRGWDGSVILPINDDQGFRFTREN